MVLFTEFLDKISKAQSLESKEALLRERLASRERTCDELKVLKEQPEIKRHLSLVFLIDRKLELLEFRKSESSAKNESVIVKIILGIRMLWPF